MNLAKSSSTYEIPVDDFTFINANENLHDVKLETKPISYFVDAWMRFSKNKSSVVAAVVILILLAFAIFVPIFSSHEMTEMDAYYSNVVPKSMFLSKYGIMTGCQRERLSQGTFDYINGIPGAITNVYDTFDIQTTGSKSTKYYDVEVDKYKSIGFVYRSLTPQEFDDIRAYEKENNIKIIYPAVDKSKLKLTVYEKNANIWYEHTSKAAAIYDENGNYKDIFKKDPESEDGYAYYHEKMGGTQLQVRVYYYEYYKYLNGKEPCFLLGADGFGQDLLLKLAVGARLSFLLGIVIASVNFIIGSLVGSVEGYYGGRLDLYTERFKEILGSTPQIVIVSLFQMYLAESAGPVVSLMFAFFLTGWIGTSDVVRRQFYRFKGHEYILAARTLGANDKRIIFRHIFPNGIGSIITSSILTIPNVIFAEAQLSFLGIVNLQSSTVTSVGVLLNNGQVAMTSYPHEIFYPAMFISLLMIAFNLFGNGLRDAFNPVLRGTGE